MHEEMRQLTNNMTFRICSLPRGYRALKGKWVFKTKLDSEGNIARYKARWVVKGFLQREGIDYFETFASVAKPSTYRLLFAIVAMLDLECEQIDMVTAFLNPELDYEIYMEQPHEFHKGDVDDVCLLLRTLYGLKQSPRYWYNALYTKLLSIGFTRCESDHCLFLRGTLWVLIYVDDLILAAPTMDEINAFKADIMAAFPCKDLGPVSYFLGVKITRDRRSRSITLSQGSYIKKILTEFGMSECRSAKTPLQKQHNLQSSSPADLLDTEQTNQYARLVGYVMYAATQTRSDLSFSVGLLCRFLAHPSTYHLAAGKHLLRYLHGTLDLGITYRFHSNASTLGLHAYTDSDWGGDISSRKSTSGYYVMAGGAPISWRSGLQSTIALSSCEAEYYGLTDVTKDVIWHQSLLTELGYKAPDLKPFLIWEDNHSAIDLANNPEYHKRTKHVDIKYHFCRHHHLSGTTTIQYCPTGDMAADGLTKALDTQKHAVFLQQTGMTLSKLS